MIDHLNKGEILVECMACGVPADLIDDNLAMGESTSIFYVKAFAKAIVEVFGDEYFRAPNAQET